MPQKDDTSPIWGGRFQEGNDPLLQEMNASIDVDIRLAHYDIRASKAHCHMLMDAHIISKKDGQKILTGLDNVQQDIDGGHMPLRKELEDIHMHVEDALKGYIGDAAERLHTARSRNDQVATDFRLWIRDASLVIDHALATLQETLCAHAEDHTDTLMPGLTHLQNAQIISFSHHMMAYVFMFGRDRQRLDHARQRLNECPLGACALAGTSFPIDRHQTAHALAFDAPMDNAMDAVSDRDFVLDFLNNATISSIHLSRLAEELVLWSSPAFGFITLPDAWTTGSSIMPQKRNPDAAELVRASCAHAIAALHSLLVTLKALPLAYSKDMQNDKAPCFQAYDQWHMALHATNAMLSSLTIHKDAMERHATTGYTNATDIADWLVRHHHVPFRQAHHIAGRIVLLAEEQQCALHQLPLAEMRRIDQRIDERLLHALQPIISMKSRNSLGGTAPEQIRHAIAHARTRYILPPTPPTLTHKP
ncbi:MAG: argininosuccinate lyase [Alphaproteobacteria bacterium GM7ARS4]|nr:argininosuccinate lyase [Alphaproteobacteria bacterium GM7ARS4]